MKEYYDTRAAEYDDWYEGSGLFAQRDRPGWSEAVHALSAALAALSPARTLDVACGTGFLTVHLPGDVTGLDQSARMLGVARRRAPEATFVQGDALELPFPDDSFDRVFTGHFYGHLEPADRARFLSKAGRLAPELIVVDSAMRPDHEAQEWQQRTLNDGSRFRVFKRYFSGPQLARELGGGEILHASPWFVAVAARRTA